MGYWGEPTSSCPSCGVPSPTRLPLSARLSSSVLRRKAIAAEATATLRDAVLGGKYPTLQPQLRELAALRMQIARAALAGPGAEGPEIHRQRLAEWSARKERVEAGLAQEIPEMNLEAKLRAADCRAVALGLPEGLALVEFVRLPILTFPSSAMPGEPEWGPAQLHGVRAPSG